MTRSSRQVTGSCVDHSGGCGLQELGRRGQREGLGVLEHPQVLRRGAGRAVDGVRRGAAALRHAHRPPAAAGALSCVPTACTPPWTWPGRRPGHFDEQMPSFVSPWCGSLPALASGISISSTTAHRLCSQCTSMQIWFDRVLLQSRMRTGGRVSRRSWPWAPSARAVTAGWCPTSGSWSACSCPRSATLGRWCVVLRRPLGPTET